MSTRETRNAEEIAAKVNAAVGTGYHWALVYGRDPEAPDAVAQPIGQDPRIAPRYLRAGARKLS